MVDLGLKSLAILNLPCGIQSLFPIPAARFVLRLRTNFTSA